MQPSSCSSRTKNRVQEHAMMIAWVFTVSVIIYVLLLYERGKIDDILDIKCSISIPMFSVDFRPLVGGMILR